MRLKGGNIGRGSTKTFLPGPSLTSHRTRNAIKHNLKRPRTIKYFSGIFPGYNNVCSVRRHDVGVYGGCWSLLVVAGDG
jgi:hypothetical protein